MHVNLSKESQRRVRDGYKHDQNPDDNSLLLVSNQAFESGNIKNETDIN